MPRHRRLHRIKSVRSAVPDHGKAGVAAKRVVGIGWSGARQRQINGVAACRLARAVGGYDLPEEAGVLR